MVLFLPNTASVSFEKKVRQLAHNRAVRSCAPGEFPGNIGPDGNEDAPPTYIDILLPFPFIIQLGIGFAGVLVMIMFLGAIKGFIGVCFYPPLGMLGLGYLVDLPRTLKRYQESELAEFKVRYDIVGWPIHPQTGKRTVRALSKRTEFCLNIIFFLAIPIVLILSVISSICAHNTYDDDDGGECYYKVNTIMLSDSPSLKLYARGCTEQGPVETDQPSSVKIKDGECTKNCPNLSSKECSKQCGKPGCYKDDDTAEEEDTKYVLQQLKNSQIKLGKKR